MRYQENRIAIWRWLLRELTLYAHHRAEQLSQEGVGEQLRGRESADVALDAIRTWLTEQHGERTLIEYRELLELLRSLVDHELKQRNICTGFDGAEAEASLEPWSVASSQHYGHAPSNREQVK